jgi:glycogen operon protein
VRRFWRGDAGMLPELATRLSGSSDLYGYSGRQPHASINFVTSHDGFTLADLVSYNEKHNEANGEDNRDGDSNNLSWNCGVEGPTSDAAILELRHRQQRNMLVTLLVSVGVPMLSGGDEMSRTQRGNNNAYCQDSAISWTPWQLSADQTSLLAFAQRLIALRASQPVLQRRTFLSGRRPGATDVLWLRPDGSEMTQADWSDGDRHALGMLLEGDGIQERDAHGEIISGDTLLILLNAANATVPFTLPSRPPAIWTCLIDTAALDGTSPSRTASVWPLAARSAAVLKLGSGVPGF